MAIDYFVNYRVVQMWFNTRIDIQCLFRAKCIVVTNSSANMSGCEREGECVHMSKELCCSNNSNEKNSIILTLNYQFQ